MTAGLRAETVSSEQTERGTRNEATSAKHATQGRLNASKDTKGRHMGREPHNRKRKRNEMDKPTIREEDKPREKWTTNPLEITGTQARAQTSEPQKKANTREETPNHNTRRNKAHTEGAEPRIGHFKGNYT
jgi:sulfite reductase alpha subunit-like flavoprotein